MINRTEINAIVKQISTVIKTELKVGKEFHDIMVSDHVKKILADNGAKDSCPSGFGELNVYDQYIMVLDKYDGRVTRTHLNKQDVEGFGCKKIIIKDAILDVILDYGEKNTIEILLSVNVEWEDKYGNWHEESPTLKTWKVLDSMYDGCIIDEKYIEDRAFNKDFEDRLVVLRPTVYKEAFRTPQNLIVKATGGFGCTADAIGRAVYYTCPYDNEKSNTDRYEVEYIIKKELEQEVLNEYCVKEEVK